MWSEIKIIDPTGGRNQTQIVWNKNTDRRWLVEQIVCCHSLWANEEPVQPYPCQQQHDNTDGQAQQEPVPEVNAVAVRVNPEFKESVFMVDLIAFF